MVSIDVFDLTIRDQTHISDAFRISQVCPHWRQVAHGTPQLWSRQLLVTIHSRGSPEADRLYRDGLKTWLMRSQPLSIPFIFEEKHAIHDWGSRAFEAWDPKSPVWDMILENASSIAFLDNLERTGLDSLETLYLKTTDSDPVLPCSILSRLRKLSIVYMLGAKIPLLLNSWPWAQLHDLDLLLSEFDDILCILSKCTNLVRASVAAFAWSGYPSVRQADITLTHLQTLSLEFDEYSRGHIVPFFDRISVPALENLVMNFAHSRRILWDQAQFSAFQLRTPTITHLEFIDCLPPVSSNDLKVILQHAQNLTHLKLPHAFDEDIIRALTYTHGVEPLVPRLHHLVLHALYDLPACFVTEFLAIMLMSRWWTDAQLALGTVPPAVARWSYIGLECSERYKPAIDAMQSTGIFIECRYFED
ncbi:F-box domain-containing protein [Favolaschia claudopus]|uniref:F-box domain-containing protein n=1 Tax=Favolaschia claudopus TaxID=2862362 RepID=A0AAW0D9P2_9AGAR